MVLATELFTSFIPYCSIYNMAEATTGPVTSGSFVTWRANTPAVTASIHSYPENAKKSFNATIKGDKGSNPMPIKPPPIDSSFVAKNRYEIQQLTICGPSFNLVLLSTETITDTLKKLQKLTGSHHRVSSQRIAVPEALRGNRCGLAFPQHWKRGTRG